MNSRRAFLLGQQVARNMSQVAGDKYGGGNPKKIERLWANQKRFGVEDGTPVHLKGGRGDRLLYLTTSAIVAVGIAGCLDLYWKLAWK